MYNRRSVQTQKIIQGFYLQACLQEHSKGLQAALCITGSQTAAAPKDYKPVTPTQLQCHRYVIAMFAECSLGDPGFDHG